MVRDTPERVHFASDGGVFSLLPGEPTEHVQLAFHAAAVATGYESSAGVLDPSGFTVELVAPGRAPG